jgi:N-acetylglucosaminyl-diphospho-decaprenol L-rhamnosyltransferase
VKRVSILVVSYATRDATKRLLDDLRALRSQAAVQVWDNASTDGTVAAVREAHPWVEVHASQENLGFAGAVAAALPHLEGELLWLLNADLRLTTPARTLEGLRACLEADPGCALVGPALADPRGGFPSGGGGAELTLRSAVAHFLGLGRLGLPALYLQPRRWIGGAPFEVDWVSGTAPLIRLEVLRAVGGFPQDSFLYAEDLALGRRLRAAGHRLLYHPGVSVVHEGQGSQPRPDGRWVRATLDDYARRAAPSKARALKGVFCGGLAARALAYRLRGDARAERLAIDARAAWRWRP